MMQTYTDIHTHILPALDDGAQNVEVAWEMLRMQKCCGVQRAILTPHYYPREESLPDFLSRRQQAYTALMFGWQEATMPRLQLGAEVHYSPELAQMDLEKLTLGESSYMLLELLDGEIPPYGEQVVEQIRRKGITPILAHVERCVYFRREPSLLLRFVQMGALGQVSAKALQSKGNHGFAESCIKNGLAHIVASDMHDQTGKDPCLGTLAAGKYGELIAWTETFAEAVWNNGPLPPFSVHPIKKSIWNFH